MMNAQLIIIKMLSIFIFHTHSKTIFFLNLPVQSQLWCIMERSLWRRSLLHYLNAALK